MQEWEKLERHENEVRGIYKRLGFEDNQGRVRRFNGKTFWPAMEAAGHSSTRFEDCDCRKALTP